MSSCFHRLPVDVVSRIQQFMPQRDIDVFPLPDVMNYETLRFSPRYPIRDADVLRFFAGVRRRRRGLRESIVRLHLTYHPSYARVYRIHPLISALWDELLSLPRVREWRLYDFRPIWSRMTRRISLPWH